MEPRQKKELYRLLNALCEDQISAEEFLRLDGWLRDDPQACEIYSDFMSVWSELQFFQVSESYQGLAGGAVRPPREQHRAAFREVVEQDLTQTAMRQALHLEESGMETGRADGGRARLSRRRLTGSDWRRLALHAAAIFMLCLTVLWLDRKLMQSQPAPIQSVAVMTDALEARWRAKGIDYRIGEKIYPGELVLETGWVKFGFHDGAEVVLEGPARFSLMAADRLDLRQGRVFARVGREAIGFSVITPSSMLIDLGTEFGIEVDSGGSSQVHMLEGQASLLAGKKGQERSNQILAAGQARQVDRASGLVRTIAVAPEAFVRDISGVSGLAWRGQTALDLADVVCGGTGFGSGNPARTIDPVTGDFGDYVERGSGSRQARQAFVPVPALRYVDGVFVPDGGSGPVAISSTGALFAECPDTCGLVRKDVTVLNKVYDTEGGSLTLGAEPFGYPHRPAISMHANIGLTFDLDALRRDLPGVEIVSFEALCAVATYPGSVSGGADFWILTDGRVCKTLLGVAPGFSEPVRIPLDATVRFLTIVTTDHLKGGEPDPIRSDRCFFGNPVLGLVPRP